MFYGKCSWFRLTYLMQPNNPLTDLNIRSVLVSYVYDRLNRWVFNLREPVQCWHNRANVVILPGSIKDSSCCIFNYL